MKEEGLSTDFENGLSGFMVARQLNPLNPLSQSDDSLIFELRGSYQDVVSSDEGPVEVRPWQNNAIANRALDLLGLLLARQGNFGGILYWAVGEGDPAWDQDLPTADPAAVHLAHETYRKPIGAQAIRYDPLTRGLEIRVTFNAAEAPGMLREFGLFGGDATADPDSGYLINYRIHPAIDKTLPRTLERTLHLQLGPVAAIAVPDLAGQTESAARQALDQAGLSAGDGDLD